MRLSSLYLLFVAIAGGAFAPTEASSVPAGLEVAEAFSPESVSLLADQPQNDDGVVLLQRESPRDPRQQKGTRLGVVLAAAGTAAVLLALAVFLLKGYLARKKEEEDREKIIGKEDEFLKAAEGEIRKQAKERMEKRLEEEKRKLEEGRNILAQRLLGRGRKPTDNDN